QPAVGGEGHARAGGRVRPQGHRALEGVEGLAGRTPRAARACAQGGGMKRAKCSVGGCNRRAITEVLIEPVRYIRPHFRKRCAKHAALKGLPSGWQARLAEILRTSIRDMAISVHATNALVVRFPTIG